MEKVRPWRGQPWDGGRLKNSTELVFHCNYVSILHRFQDIITYFPNFKEVT